MQRRDVLEATDGEDRGILSWARIVHVCGCMFDDSQSALRAADVLLQSQNTIATVGGGERAAHIAKIALGIGMPTGGISQLISACEEMNAEVLAALLEGRGVVMQREHIWDLGLVMSLGQIPIMLAIPPYSLWDTPTHGGMPEHGAEFGSARLAAAFGIKESTVLHKHDAPGDVCAL